jgi:hypothetical protein
MTIDSAQGQQLQNSEVFARGRASVYSFDQNKPAFEEEESSEEDDDKNLQTNRQLSDTAKA